MRVFRFLLIAALVLLAAVPAGAANDFSSIGDKALYNLESGALGTDSSGNGNGLTNNGVVTANTTYYKQGAASAEFVAASSQSLSRADADFASGFPLKSGESNTSFTVCLWVYPQVDGTIIGKWDAGNNKRSWRLYTSSRYLYVDLGHTSGTASQNLMANKHRLVANQWNHVAFSYDDSTKQGIFVVMNSSTGAVGLYTPYIQTWSNNISVTDAPFRIGGDEDGNYYDGMVDEVVIFNEALSYNEMIAVRMGLVDGGHVDKTWYVRPEQGSLYGTGDGSSYANAFDGLRALPGGNGRDWGGIEPGDTLYICGHHLHDCYNREYLATQADVYLPKGTSSAEITLRGDDATYPGVICGGGILSYRTWTQESAPNDSVWKFDDFAANYAHDYTFWEDVTINSALIPITGATDNNILTKRASIAECQANLGSQYATSYNTGGILYVSCRDGGDPTGRIVSGEYGYEFKFNESADYYVTFKNITFNAYKVDLDGLSVTPSHVTFDGCTINTSPGNVFSIGTGMHYWKITGCTLRYGQNGIYTMSTHNTNGPSYYEFSDNYIEYMGYATTQPSSDAHCIGIQGGHDGLIDGNECNYCGTGPLLFTYVNQECKDNTISNNFVHNLHTLNSATGYGVSTMTHTDSLSDKSGNVFYNNIVVGATDAYRGQFEDLQKFYNNVAIDCNICIEGSRSSGTVPVWGPAIEAKNNICFYSTGDTTDFAYHINFATSADADHRTMDFDANHYYPAGTPGDGLFKFLTAYDTLAAAQSGKSVEANGQVGDPLFVNAGGSYALDMDFKLQINSPCIGEGLEVAGVTEDYWANTFLNPPSIGVHEAGSAGPLGMPAAFGPFPNMVGRGGRR